MSKKKLMINFNDKNEELVLDGKIYFYKDFPEIKELSEILVIKGDFTATNKSIAVATGFSVIFDVKINFLKLSDLVDIYVSRNCCRYKNQIITIDELEQMLKTHQYTSNKKIIDNPNLILKNLSSEYLWSLF